MNNHDAFKSRRRKKRFKLEKGRNAWKNDAKIYDKKKHKKTCYN